jgi:YHS domain-containing protein
VVFWSVLSVTGLAVQYLFRALDWIPTTRPKVIAGDSLRFDYTTVLDVVALVALAGLYWLHRNRERLGGGSGYATDPVCGMQVETQHAPAVVEHAGVRISFCSDHCRARFDRDPGRYLDPVPPKS